MNKILSLIVKASRKPPKVVIQRIQLELSEMIERYSGPRREKRFDVQRVFGCSADEMWATLESFDFPVVSRKEEMIGLLEEDKVSLSSIFAETHELENPKINILGSGDIFLGENIEWNKDHKVDRAWENQYVKDYEYNNLENPSDVKMAWELSRLQWLIPTGQAYVITQDDRYARKIKNLLEDWVDKNPYAHSINWACTMEPAMRLFSFLWFFFVCSKAESWADTKFRKKFLKSLYLHGDFVDRHFEMSDVNGNHCTADASALYIIGLLFRQTKAGAKWLQRGRRILESEIIRQVPADGVDFEGSVPYHRLVTELFFFPALVAERNGECFSEEYRNRVLSMAVFTQYYMRNDGSSPLLGDADDARLLPFGTQLIGDHRYLYEWIYFHWDKKRLSQEMKGLSELYWLLGDDMLNEVISTDSTLASRAFPESGYYVLRNKTDHLFVDAAPIGLAGRGGHGHNDCLSFELFLKNRLLITDSGSFAYTGNYKERNAFRSSQYHNVVMVDGIESNRFISEDNLWNMHYDAVPQVLDVDFNELKDSLIATHFGYKKLKVPVDLKRTFELDHDNHVAVVKDEISSKASHDYSVFFHLHEKVQLMKVENERLEIENSSRRFAIEFSSELPISINVIDGWESPSYGIKKKRKTVIIKCNSQNFNLTTVFKGI